MNFGFTKPSKKPSQVDNNNNENQTEGIKIPSSSTVKRTFNSRWLEEYKWLVFSDGKMKCSKCIASKRSNPFAFSGSINFQRSALERHQVSDDHRIATSNKIQSETFTKTVNEKFDKMKPSVVAMVNTVSTMIEEDISDRKFNSLIQMQVVLLKVSSQIFL